MRGAGWMRGNTLPGALDAAAAACPDTAVTFPSSGERLTLVELADTTSTVARALVAAGVAPGGRVGVLSRNNADFFVALIAVTRAGAAACPLPLPTSARDLGGYATRLAATTSAAGVRLVLTGDGVAGVSKRLQPVLADLRFAGVGELARTVGAGRALPDVCETDLAVVQFTSGSTAVSKGVALTHRNVVHGTAAIVDGIGLGEGDHGATWLPLFHDMGLFGALSAILAGVPMTVWSPSTFVKDPAGWLEDFLGRGCTVCPAPNFGYESLLAAVGADDVGRLDMRRWRVALNGAEPVNPATVELFRERFEPAGFAASAMFPVYGMAEATLAVTFPPLGRAPVTTWVDRDRLAADGLVVSVDRATPGSRGLVGLGQPVRGMRVRIVDDRGVALADDRVGEIEIQGDSVTRGYLSRDPVTDGLVTPEGWLRTGDLGFQRKGELYVSGRRKEMIIVRGVNYYPEDAEAAVRDAPGIHRRRCVAVADATTTAGAENVTIIAETAFETPSDRVRLAADLRLAVSSALGLHEVVVRLVSPDALPRTSSGKFQRLLARELARTEAL